jgi:hypothetical protein
MSTELRTLNQDTINKLVLNGDMKDLTNAQKTEYYGYRCQQAGLDPAAKPFDILVLNGKTILYANASCTQQLTSIHKLSHQITAREVQEGIYCVFCRVTGADGRSTENMGAVPLDGLKGDLRSNAMMKATTKAIRRTVLAHVGLGMLDEDEVATIEEPPAEYVWTEEEKDGAKAMLGEFAERLAEGGMNKPEIDETLAKPASTIGLPDLSSGTWTNRFLGYRERHLAKLAA